MYYSINLIYELVAYSGHFTLTDCKERRNLIKKEID